MAVHKQPLLFSFNLSYYNEYKSYLRYCTDDDVAHRNVCLPPVSRLVYLVYCRQNRLTVQCTVNTLIMKRYQTPRCINCKPLLYLNPLTVTEIRVQSDFVLGNDRTRNFLPNPNRTEPPIFLPNRTEPKPNRTFVHMIYARTNSS